MDSLIEERKTADSQPENKTNTSRSVDASDRPYFRIKRSTGWFSTGLPEAWAYRDLLYFFVWRDLKVRYKQTILGAAWAILQPFLTMVIFSLFFGQLIGVPSDGIPYPIFSYAALVPWTFFANSLNQASNSLVNNANMLKKIYFPRLVMPSSTIFSGLVDFFLAFAVLLVMMLFFRTFPTLNVVWLPLFVVQALLTSLGVGLWLSSLNVRFRDVRYVVPFLTQAWFFMTPIAYSSNLLSEPWRTLYGLNPMAGVVEGFRWALLGTDTAPGAMSLVSGTVTILVLISGLVFFRRMERTFADIV